LDQPLLLKEKKNSICTLMINRPEKQNALSIESVELLASTLKELEKDGDVRAVILRGAGESAFCSGFDIGSLPTRSKGDANRRLKLLDMVEALLQGLVNFPYGIDDFRVCLMFMGDYL
jgi:enoyl-CoA hydratase/carnithine racemase